MSATYLVAEYAPEGHCPPPDQLYLEEFDTLEEARTAVRERLGALPAGQRWTPSEDAGYSSDWMPLEAYSMSTEDRCGGYSIERRRDAAQVADEHVRILNPNDAKWE